MRTPFVEYIKIKDNLCLCYLGAIKEFVMQLLAAQVQIEQQLPGINIYLCFSDEMKSIVGENNKCFYLSELKIKKQEMAVIKELTYDFKNNPVVELMKESNLTFNYPI